MISLSACLDAPILPPLSNDDFGVKKRVNDLGVIVGGFFCLLLPRLVWIGRVGEEQKLSAVGETALELSLYSFSCDPKGV